MRRAVPLCLALVLALAPGCGGESKAEKVADGLRERVKEVDGGDLKDVSCESRSTELENSEQWECSAVWSDGETEEDSVYSVQTTPEGEVNTFAVME